MAETDQFRPKNCKKGNILAPHTLDQRITRFRWENCVPAMIQRFGSDALSRFIWGRLSPAGRAANSTRELKKLSKEDRRDARRPNAGKHSAKAGGWTLDQNKTEPEAPALADAGVEPAKKPASSRSRRNRRTRSIYESDCNGHQDRQPSSFAMDQCKNQRQNLNQFSPSVIHGPGILEPAIVEPATKPKSSKRRRKNRRRSIHESDDDGDQAVQLSQFAMNQCRNKRQKVSQLPPSVMHGPEILEPAIVEPAKKPESSKLPRKKRRRRSINESDRDGDQAVQLSSFAKNQCRNKRQKVNQLPPSVMHGPEILKPAIVCGDIPLDPPSSHNPPNHDPNLCELASSYMWALQNLDPAPWHEAASLDPGLRTQSDQHAETHHLPSLEDILDSLSCQNEGQMAPFDYAEGFFHGDSGRPSNTLPIDTSQEPWGNGFEWEPWIFGDGVVENAAVDDDDSGRPSNTLPIDTSQEPSGDGLEWDSWIVDDEVVENAAVDNGDSGHPSNTSPIDTSQEPSGDGLEEDSWIFDDEVVENAAVDDDDSGRPSNTLPIDTSQEPSGDGLEWEPWIFGDGVVENAAVDDDDSGRPSNTSPIDTSQEPSGDGLEEDSWIFGDGVVENAVVDDWDGLNDWQRWYEDTFG